MALATSFTTERLSGLSLCSSWGRAGLELERLHAESSEPPCLFWNTGHRTLNHPVAEVIQLSVQIETLATTRT